MNDNILMIRTLVDRFFDGETTLAEEELLYDFFRQESAALPEDLRPLQEMFLDLAAVQQVAQPVQQQAKHRRWPRWVAAAAAAVVLIGGVTTLFLHSNQGEEEYVAYVYGERTTDRDVVLTEMQKTMTALAATDGEDVMEEQLKAMFGF